MIEVQNISKVYGKKTVLNNVSLTIPEGSITSFIGPNGAGKSTLLSVLGRLISSSSGQVYLEGNEISSFETKDLAKKLSVLKQSNQIPLRLTVRDLISFGRFPYSNGRLTTEDNKKIDAALSYMELTELEDQYIDQLSGGQQQRTYIAMVLAQDTDYILLDEPLNNLDIKHAVQIMKVLRKLVNELGKTIVIVIHDINFASCYSDYIVALKNGELVASGKKDDMMTGEMLSSIYDLPIHVQEVNKQKISVYYT